MSYKQYGVKSPVKHGRVPILANEKVKKFQKIYFIFKINPNLGMSQVGGTRSAQVWFRKKYIFLPTHAYRY